MLRLIGNSDQILNHYQETAFREWEEHPHWMSCMQSMKSQRVGHGWATELNFCGSVWRALLWFCVTCTEWFCVTGTSVVLCDGHWVVLCDGHWVVLCDRHFCGSVWRALSGETLESPSEHVPKWGQARGHLAFSFQSLHYKWVLFIVYLLSHMFHICVLIGDLVWKRACLWCWSDVECL